MASDEPPFLKVGTEVSAKFKGAFCEAKVKRIFKNIKFRVVPKEGSTGTLVVEESHLKGDPIYEVNQIVDVQHGGKYIKAQILHIKDYSTYDVVFDDGDEKRLKRTQMVLKGAKHYNEEHSLDALPLYNPEQFSSPVVAKIIRKNKMDKRDREARQGAGTPKKERVIVQHDVNSDDEKPSSSSATTSRGKVAAKNETKKTTNDGDEDGRRTIKKTVRQKRAAAHAASAALADQHGGLSPSDEENNEDDEDDEDENNTSDETGDESHSDNEIKEATPEKSPTKSLRDKDKEKDKEPKKKTTKFAPGNVVMVYGDSKKTGTCSLAVVINPKIYKALKGMKPLTGNDIPLRGFMLEGRYFSVSPLVLKPFTAKPLAGFEKEPHKTAYNRAKDFLESKGKTLPSSWNLKEHILAESTMKKKKDKEKEKEREKDKDKDKDATSDSDSEDSEETTDDETDKEFAQARDAFVAHFYKFQEENATPINKQPVLGGKPLDIYKFYRVVHRLGGWKQVCAKGKWKKALMRMKLEGCPGATPATVKNAYSRYLLLFSQQYTRLGWSLSELTMPAGRRQGRLLLRQMDKDKEKEKEKMEKGEKDKDKDKTKSRKMSVDDEKKEKNDDRSEKEMSESSTKLEKIEEKPEIAQQHQQQQQQQSNKIVKKLDDEEKDKLPVKDKEKEEQLAKAAKVKREHISPSPTRSTASSASKDEKEKKKERQESGSNTTNQQKETIETPQQIKRSDSNAKEFKRERSVAKDLLHRKERKRTDSVSTTSDEESRKRKEKRKSVSSSSSNAPPNNVKEKSVERGGPSQQNNMMMMGGQPFDLANALGQIKDDFEEGHVQAHLLCQFRQGQNVRALHLGNWYTARVLTSETPKVEQLVSMLKAKPGETGLSADSVTALREAIKKSGAFVHYLGWNSRYDEFIPLHKMRVTFKDEEDSRQKTTNAIGDQLPAERIQLFMEWSSSPEGMDSFKQRNSDEKKSFLQTIGPYRPRRFSITQVEQLSESLQQKLQKEANERSSQPSIQSPPGTSTSAAGNLQQQPSTSSGKPSTTGHLSVSSFSSTPTKGLSQEEQSHGSLGPSPTADQYPRRVRSPIKGTTPSVQVSEEQVVLIGNAASSIKKEVIVKVKMEETDARQKEEKERKEKEEKIKEDERKKKEDEERRKKEEKEETEKRRKMEEEMERMKKEKEKEEEEERKKIEERRKMEEEEKKKKEADERNNEAENKEREEKDKVGKRKHEGENESMKSSTSTDGSEKNKGGSPTMKQRKEDVENEIDMEKLLNEAREVCARKEENSEVGSGAGTPSREENDDADKWSVSDNQSVAGGVHLTSPTRGFRGKRKRLNGRQSLPLKKKKEEEMNENEEEESDDDIEIHKETFASLRKTTMKAMEIDGSIDDYQSLDLDALRYPYNYQPRDLEESRLVGEYVRHRMDDLHHVYEESKNVVLKLNRMVNEARLRLRKAERAEEKAAANCETNPSITTTPTIPQTSTKPPKDEPPGIENQKEKEVQQV
ncbi:unnamed protein product, partial [Mesorhabditis belari]|uniref:ARID domain-containing protein n=1 Tax=Mesorhabditis belari TaxID=2138241 RepID=A0AAF3F1I0_9BILA